MTEHTPAGPAGAGHHGHFLPAMGRTWLLPLYDPFTRLLGVGGLHRQLVDRAGIEPGQRVLEIGCGTGNLLLLVARRYPAADVVGLDPDPDAVARTRRKAARDGLAVRLDRGSAAELPYPDGSVDRVLSSLMLHHVDPAEKPRVLREVHRVLRPGGTLHLADLGGPGRGHGGRSPAGLQDRLVRRSARLADNLGDRIPALMRDAGLVDVREDGTSRLLLGRVTHFRASRT